MRDSAIHFKQFCVSSCMSVQFRLAQRNAQKRACFALRVGHVASSNQYDVLAVCGALALGHDFKMFLICFKPSGINVKIKFKKIINKIK